MLLWKGWKGESSLQSFYHGQERANPRLGWSMPAVQAAEFQLHYCFRLFYQQFISRTLPVNIYFYYFFVMMVTTQNSPSHPSSLQENREYFSKLLSCNKCTQQMLCEFSQNKKRLSCLYNHSIL